MEAATAQLHEPFPTAPETVDSKPRARVLTRRRVARTALLVALACMGAGLGYLRAWPPVATVMSASMAPTIETGDIVVLRRLQAPPRVGDVIAISVPEVARARYGYPPQVIHRIVRIAPDGQIATKGDAREKPDPFTVRRSSVEAEVVASVPAAGRVLAFLTSTLGLIWLAAGVVLLVVLPLLERQREAAAGGVEGIDDMRDELRSDMQTVLEELVRLQARVDTTARTRADLEHRLAELAAALEALPERIEPEATSSSRERPQWPVAGPRPVPEPAPVPVHEPEAEPEQARAIEPWTNVFLDQAPVVPPPGPPAEPAPPARPAPVQWHSTAPRVRRRSGGLLALIERRTR